MKIFLFSLSILAIASVKGWCQSDQAIESELIRLETDWHNTYRLKDTSLLKKILADEFIMINSRGNQFGKAAVVNALKTDKARYDSIYPYDMKFIHYGNSVAVIGKTKETGIENGKAFDNCYFWTDLFIKKGTWQCVLAQTAGLPKRRMVLGTRLSSKESAMITEINESLKTYSAEDKFSGVVLIARDSNILYQAAFGSASKENNVANELNTKFNLASITKMFTGIAIAQLAEQGKLSFDDSINKFLTELPSTLTSGITIHQLLTHTSGLSSFFTDEFHKSNHAAYRSLKDYLMLILKDKPQFTPGSNWAYSNTGYLLLGLIVEKISGISYFDFIQHNIFEKAGMENSGFYESDRPDKNIATAYTKNNRYVNDSINWTIPLFIAPVKGTSAGGAYASATDMFHFAISLMSNRLLNKHNTNEVISGKVSYGSPELLKMYAYGFASQKVNGKLITFHDGGANGISANIDIYTELGYTVIILSNYDFPAGIAVNERIRQCLTK